MNDVVEAVIFASVYGGLGAITTIALTNLADQAGVEFCREYQLKTFLNWPVVLIVLVLILAGVIGNDED